MFRFINSGIKQSATTLPNSIYHSPSLNKKVNDDEKENQKLSLISQPRVDQTICIYRRNIEYGNCKYFENLYSFLERRSLILEFSYHLGLFKLHPFWLGKAVRDVQIPKLINHKNQEKLLSNKNPELKTPKSSGYKSQEKLSSNKHSKIRSNENKHKPISIKYPEIKPLNKPNSNDKPVDELFNETNIKNFIEMGHDLNTKGCDAAEISYTTTALQYWNAAAQVNYPPSQFNLGVYYESHNDLVEAEKWYRLAIKSGRHPTAAYNLALLLNNKLDDHLKDEIKDLLTISASQGSKEAMKCIECIKAADETS